MDNDKKSSLNLPDMVLICFLTIFAVFALVAAFHVLTRNDENQGGAKHGFENTKVKHGVTKEY